MRTPSWLFAILLSTFLVGCLVNGNTTTTQKTSAQTTSGYDLEQPTSTDILPDTLHEVSGLTDIDSRTVACVQDENGVIFFYDLEKREIVRQFQFHLDGDYEGITRIGNVIYILRSDGIVYGVENYEDLNFILHTYTTGIPAANNEGLCHDPVNNRLLIACKSKLGKGPEFKDKRAIYAFDLKTKKLSDDPVFEFDVQTMREFAKGQKIDLPTRKKGKDGGIEEPILKFRASAIGVHPIRKQLYILSAADHLFFIFDLEGKLLDLEPLDPHVFNKAEGITFMENGDMLITNEGQDAKPTLLRFTYNK
ncbi:MAG: hypothetical protein WAR83_05750 [Flavobacteriales bacterium]|nr:hypothetical protein [Flavobacteriales bacterium]